MEHKLYKKLLTLKYFGDLNKKENSEINLHLKKCSACKIEFTKLKNILSVSKTNDVEVPQKLIYSARRELREKILSQNNNTQSKKSILEVISDIFFSNFKLIGFGTAIFIIGIFVGGKFLNTQNFISISNNNSAAEFGKSFISGVKYLVFDNNSNEIEMYYETALPTKIKGNLHNAEIQKLVEHSILREDNSGIRLQLLEMISNHLSNGNKISNSLSQSIAKVAMFDENAGARRLALDNLLHLPFDNEIRQAVVHVLANDANVGLRTSAINFLATKNSQGESIDKETKDVLKKFISTNENSYIKTQAMNLLQEQE